MDHLRPTLTLARRIARKTKPEKIVIMLSKVGRSGRQVKEAIALTHSFGSWISASFLKIDAADADHWNSLNVLLRALM